MCTHGGCYVARDVVMLPAVFVVPLAIGAYGSCTGERHCEQRAVSRAAQQQFRCCENPQSGSGSEEKRPECAWARLEICSGYGNRRSSGS